MPGLELLFSGTTHQTPAAFDLAASSATRSAQWLTPTYVVDLATDESDGNYSAGDLSLREAISLANNSNSQEVIAFDPALTGDTILLTLGQLNITGTMTIEGPGSGSLTVDGYGQYRVFDIGADADVSMSGLTVEGGIVSGDGGGIRNQGNLTLSDVTLEYNNAWGNGNGGNIFNSGTLTLTDCTVQNGYCSGNGSGICNMGDLTITDSTITHNYCGFGAGIYNSGEAVVDSSTISANVGPLGGGINNAGWIYLLNSTISGNDSSGGGGIYNTCTLMTLNVTIANNTIYSGGEYGGGDGGGVMNVDGGIAVLYDTIVADNTLDSNPDDVSGTFEDYSLYNLIGAIDGSTGLTGNGTLYGTGSSPSDARLGALADNGGPTQTMALLSGSPAIDAGCTGLVAYDHITTDQRGQGFDRFLDGDGNASVAVDIGAYEYNG